MVRPRITGWLGRCGHVLHSSWRGSLPHNGLSPVAWLAHPPRQHCRLLLQREMVTTVWHQPCYFSAACRRSRRRTIPAVLL